MCFAHIYKTDPNIFPIKINAEIKSLCVNLQSQTHKSYNDQTTKS